MSYTVLARKWRPRQFDQMIGQAHVLRALVNALEAGRLHHAYLFTGTRGVGKTTVARILAKALNCETGVTAKPCGVCRACEEIDAGRFVDLIEVDAASRTKVDDTRELLDNVQYAPTGGRYKVYLIDEVHMLSTHSFNALLKTLEEPPPHVKFLLATTDPQKLPVTVLSRCLQFNLKRLPPEELERHLAAICEAEAVPAEAAALAALAAAAEGSVRDSLSLLDQAIAYGGGRIDAGEVAEMLGTLDRQQILELIQAVAAGDGRRVLELVERMDERSPDYSAALGDMALALQRVAVLQVVDAGLESGPDAAVLGELAAALTPEDTQLHYQIALMGRREVALSSHPRSAFEMTLLRMLAFRPAAGGEAEPRPAATASAARRAGRQKPAAVPAGASRSGEPEAAAPRTSVASGDWSEMMRAAGLRGAVLQLASHCVLERREKDVLHLSLDAEGEPMNTPGLRKRLEEALSAASDAPVRVRIESAGQVESTPAREAARARAERQQAARVAIENDPNVKAMQESFGAVLHPDTVEPLGDD